MKERYEAPSCEIVRFEAVDVITTSDLGDGGNED